MVNVFPQDVLNRYPTIKIYASFPIIPFIILSVGDYHVAPRAGGYRIDIHLWYGVGIIHITRISILEY
jgi:hypothetical protein